MSCRVALDCHVPGQHVHWCHPPTSPPAGVGESAHREKAKGRLQPIDFVLYEQATATKGGSIFYFLDVKNAAGFGVINEAEATRGAHSRKTHPGWRLSTENHHMSGCVDHIPSARVRSQTQQDGVKCLYVPPMESEQLVDCVGSGCAPVDMFAFCACARTEVSRRD
jgi:hypothetical protein